MRILFTILLLICSYYSALGQDDPTAQPVFPDSPEDFHFSRSFRLADYSFVRGESAAIAGKVLDPTERYMGVVYLSNKTLVDHSAFMEGEKAPESADIVLKGKLVEDPDITEYHVVTINEAGQWIRYRFEVQMKEPEAKVESIEYWMQNGVKVDHLLLPRFSNKMDEADRVEVALKGRHLDKLKIVQLSASLKLKFDRLDAANSIYVFKSDSWDFNSFHDLNPQSIYLHANGDQRLIKIRTDQAVALDEPLGSQPSDGVSKFSVTLKLTNVMNRVRVKVSNMDGNTFIQQIDEPIEVNKNTATLELRYAEGQKKPSKDFDVQLTLDNMMKNPAGQAMEKTMVVSIKIEDKNAKIVASTNQKFIPKSITRFTLEPLGELTFAQVNKGDAFDLEIDGSNYPVTVEIPDNDKISFVFEVPEFNNQQIYELRGATFRITIGGKEFRGDFPNLIGYPEWPDALESNNQVFTGETVRLNLKQTPIVDDLSKLLDIKQSEGQFTILDTDFSDDKVGIIKIDENADEEILVYLEMNGDIVDTLQFERKQRLKLSGQLQVRYQENEDEKSKVVDLEEYSLIKYYKDSKALTISLVDENTFDPFEVSNMYASVYKADGSTEKDKIMVKEKQLIVPTTNLGIDPGDEYKIEVVNGNERLTFRAKEKAPFWQLLDFRSGISAASYFSGGLELSDNDTSLVSSKWNYLDGIMLGVFYPVWRNKRNKDIFSLGLTFGVQSASDTYKKDDLTETTTTVETDDGTQTQTVVAVTPLERTITETFPRTAISLLVFENLQVGYAFGGGKSGGWTLGVSASILDVSKFVFGATE